MIEGGVGGGVGVKVTNSSIAKETSCWLRWFQVVCQSGGEHQRKRPNVLAFLKWSLILFTKFCKKLNFFLFVCFGFRDIHLAGRK